MCWSAVAHSPHNKCTANVLPQQMCWAHSKCAPTTNEEQMCSHNKCAWAHSKCAGFTANVLPQQMCLGSQQMCWVYSKCATTTNVLGSQQMCSHNKWGANVLDSFPQQMCLGLQPLCCGVFAVWTFNLVFWERGLHRVSRCCLCCTASPCDVVAASDVLH